MSGMKRIEKALDEARKFTGAVVFTGLAGYAVAKAMGKDDDQAAETMLQAGAMAGAGRLIQKTINHEPNPKKSTT